VSVVPVLVTVPEVAEVESVVAVPVPVMLEPVDVRVRVVSETVVVFVPVDVRVRVVSETVVVSVLVADVTVSVELVCVGVDVIVQIDVTVTVSDKVVVTVVDAVTVSGEVVINVLDAVTVSGEVVINVLDAVTVSDEVVITVTYEADVVMVPDVAAVTAPSVDEAVTFALLMSADVVVAINAVVVSTTITAGSERRSVPAAPAAGPLGTPRRSSVLYAICAWWHSSHASSVLNGWKAAARGSMHMSSDAVPSRSTP